MATPLRLGIVGSTGRMGREIAALAERDPEIIAGGGVSSATASGMAALAADCDVLVDFSTPGGTMAALEAAMATGTPLVTGTTGMTPEQVTRLREAAGVIPVWYARNMSTGVSLLQRILPEVARALAGYDIELTEMHHRHKVDAPSGTALMLAAAIERGLDATPDRVHGREGHAPRQASEIGIHAIRGGGNAGEHQVIFASDEEEIRISHRAYSRSAFAAGAIRAAKAIHGQPPGWYGPE